MINKRILCDKEDEPILSRFNWTISKQNKTEYAFTSIFVGNKRTILGMHRLIMGMRKAQIDHINRNGLDNRKQNLRYCTHSQNASNSKRKDTSLYRGVYRTAEGKYHARITKDKKRFHLGSFKTPKDAAKAYDKKALEICGQYAEFNFPENIYNRKQSARVKPTGFVARKALADQREEK